MAGGPGIAVLVKALEAGDLVWWNQRTPRLTLRLIARAEDHSGKPWITEVIGPKERLVLYKQGQRLTVGAWSLIPLTPLEVLAHQAI